MKKLILSVSSLGLLAAASQAAIVTVTLGNHIDTTTPYGGLLTYNGGPKTVSNFSPFTASAFSNSFTAYCVDLDHSAAINTSYQADAKSIGFALGVPGQRLAYLYNTFAAGATDKEHRAALQIAIWEARYDSTLDLTIGNFQASGINATVKGFAQTYLTATTNNTNWTTDAVFYDGLANEQDLMGPIPVPEPGTMVALGLGAIALLKKKRNK